MTETQTKDDFKRCGGPCGQQRPLRYFHRSNSSADGHQHYCLICRRAYDRQYYLGHERHRRAQMVAWARAHPGAANERLEKRRDMLKAAAVASGGGLSAQQREGFVAQVGACMGCGETEGLSFDHVVPLSKGGLDTLANAQTACSRCNRSKRNRIIDFRPRWRAQQEKAARLRDKSWGCSTPDPHTEK